MAVFEKWFEQDLHKDLKTRHCEGIVLTGDNLSNLIGVRLYEDGEPATLTGVVTLHAIRADGTTVVDNQGGTISGNAVSFTLKEACMAIPGPLVVLLRLTNGDVKTSILRAVFTVDISESGMIIDPGRVIPSIDELLAMLAEMEEAKDAANQAADDAEGAAASADTAAAAANAAANAANTAAGSVNTAITNAQAATTAANSAASAANTAAAGADDARDFAYAAGEDANGAANAAYTSASAADTAAAAANTAAQSATTAAAAANTAAEGADDAADDANQAVDDLRQFMKQVTPADTATGRVITFEPTTEGPFIGLEVFGRCEQDTEPSPQLWPETGAATTGEVSGVTVTGSANGGYVIQGAATADRYLYPNTGALYDAAVTLEAGTYTVNANPGLMVSVRQWASDSIYSSIAYGNPATFTLAASQKITVNPVVPNGATVDIVGGFVMLAAGETAQTYQPYTGEITLPSPTHPRDIAVAGEGGTLRMGTVGKNLAYMERGALDASGAEVASTVAWRTGYLPIMGACVYASKYYLYSDTASNLVAHFYGDGMAYLGSTTVLAYNEAQRATELSALAEAAGAVFVRFAQTYPQSANTPDSSQLMITFGDAGGEYPEYVHATGCRAALLIPDGAGLRGLPVTANDSWNYQDTEGRYWVCDVANYDAGVCTRRVGKTTFASLTRVTYSSSTGLFKSTSPIPTALFENHIMTRIYESVPNDSGTPPTLEDGQICAINTGAAVQWKDSRFTSVKDMLAAIGDEPIYYMLRSSSVTYMTDEQKNSFNALRSCNGITHAFAEDAARPYFTASVYSNFLEHLDETVEEAVQVAVSEAVEPIHDEVENIGERVDDLESYVRHEPHNYLFDGRDLSKVFGSAEAFHTALAAEDFSKIRVGDYWPLKLNGTFRDYGAYTVPSGTAYFTDAALTTQGGTTSAKIEGQYESATAVKFKVSGSNVYCAIGDCLDYFERTCNNAVVNLEVAGINNYWRYGDSGDLTGNNKPHITFVSRDCLPFTMRMRKANAVWENTEETNPWRGSALFKTLNDPDHGVVKLIAATDIGAYMYAGPNGGGMRALMETKAAGATTATSWGWADRGKLFLPFESEIWGHGVWGGNSGYTLGVNLQLPIFIGTRRHISKGIGNGASRNSWWTASSYSGYATTFCNVGYTGNPASNGAVSVNGAPVCFVMI